MKTVVLDDDPTGTQSASGVRVLLESDADLIERALRTADSVYVQTNSRAIDESSAVELVSRVRRDALTAGERLGEPVQFVLRGDSTLRGHVFAETEAFLDGDAVMLFVPAFPDGGRTTRDGVHYVRIDGVDVRADESEYAADPVFPFDTSVLEEYVQRKSGRLGVPVPLEAVQGVDELEAVLLDAPAGAVVVPDAVTNDDIRRIAEAVRRARAKGASIVVRSASPLAAMLAGVESDGLLERPLVDRARPTLLVCGSHTEGATRQLAGVVERHGEPVVIDTVAALTDPAGAASEATTLVLERIDRDGLAVVTSERVRLAEHDTLNHGERVMTALTDVVQAALPAVEVVVSKGGITSAEVASTGIGARSAVVLGQVLPGVSVWELEARDGRMLLYVVVPGNVGGPETLVEVLDALRLDAPVSA
ncbi:four-carbon acid sugar kinase family protein [Agromyces aerolatus]|uniref:four-carbon acid sugar kinase family protein n=1 Tax=Agromyces sp. LY-1074 TaxID=3074080 RepID=UPI00285482F0|nr:MULTISPECIES: four-carbon acid sugar kinase family protein [unclassified Agromyces]MDR5698867.1 four-carbon acid sugar kinase family protein [Agromyces sp. LY-1074]MDR5705355.1 four-carbon acid sugar kinase family protein [Agromyces sp. LY-1358]